MKINTTEQNGKNGLNNLIVLTKPKKMTEKEVYKKRQEELIKEILIFYGNRFKIKKMEITKEEFEVYNKLREEGIFNMFNVRAICEVTGLEREQVFFIMENYSKLKEGLKE